jgi:hypothetical protein
VHNIAAQHVSTDVEVPGKVHLNDMIHVYNTDDIHDTLRCVFSSVIADVFGRLDCVFGGSPGRTANLGL